MLSKRHINEVIVAKDCARTSTVQVWDSSAASTYIGAGEVVVTDPSGLVLDATAVVGVPEICIQYNSPDGATVRRSKVIARDTIKNSNFKAYAAAAEKVMTFTPTLTGATAVIGYTYMLKFRLDGYCATLLSGLNNSKTVSFTATTTAMTDVVIGLTAAINKAFSGDPIWRIVATATNTNTKVTLTGQPLAWELGKFEYNQIDFLVEDVNVGGTVATTVVLFPGTGIYKRVAEQEYYARQDKGVYPLTNALYPVTPPVGNAEATKTYDTYVLQWERSQGSFSQDVTQHGVVTLFLAIGTINQGDDLKATLDAWLA